jgi:hypothetical protein
MKSLIELFQIDFNLIIISQWDFINFKFNLEMIIVSTKDLTVLALINYIFNS